MKLKWQFGEALDALGKEVGKIVGDTTVDQLLSELPAEIPYDDVQDAKLVIRKLSDIVWTAGYMIYRSPKEKCFEKASVLFSTEPTLLFTLYMLREELKKHNSKKKKGDDESQDACDN